MMTLLSEGITTVKNEQAKLRAERKRVAAELKNAQRRKRRLRTKARQLSNEDILAVLLMRQEQGPMRAADEKGKCSCLQFIGHRVRQRPELLITCPDA